MLHCKLFIKFAHETPIVGRWVTKNDMDRQHYNRLKVVLAEKEKTSTWHSEQMGRNIGTVSRWMTSKVQPSVEQLFDIAKHLDVDVRELLVATK